jgi:acyl-homoserine-lactone acylase
VKALGRRAEADGDTALYEDLRMKLFMDPDTLQALYRTSPSSLKRLMDAFADGLNFYLYRHRDVQPRVITRFEPWMALAFTEGSIGGDIERVSVPALAAFYGDSAVRALQERGDGDPLAEPDGSNGIAIAPSLTRSHHALLWINPHTSFYFRSELHVSSDEGLDAYGAVTWGQFFVYQGFNATAGWMHTSSGVDNIDEFLETISRKNGRLVYRHGSEELPLVQRTITVPYRTATGMAQRTFTAYYTRHGPVVRKQGDRWVSVSLMQRPVNALVQSYTRTKCADLEQFRRIMEHHSNASNNTLFADAKGDIAYLHSNYIPRRDTSLDWTLPVDGSDPATDYHGVMTFEQTPNAVNPPSGWVYNSNNWPWSAAGPSSPRREDYPRFVETGIEETPRGMHALRELTGSRDWTMQSLTAAAFDSYLPAFERLLPRLIEAYDHTALADSTRAKLSAPIAMLRRWDFHWGRSSVPTTLAIYWAERAVRAATVPATALRMSAQTYVATRAEPSLLLGALAQAADTLTQVFGTWKTPWGEINRFQRLDGRIEPHFDDAQPSQPVPFTSGIWGSLASFGARPYPDTKKWYGSSGNSFVAVVEFGDSLKAMAVTAGGESGHPASPHFGDQVARYIQGELREVYFYRAQLKGHIEREYHPGE